MELVRNYEDLARVRAEKWLTAVEAAWAADTTTPSVGTSGVKRVRIGHAYYYDPKGLLSWVKVRPRRKRSSLRSDPMPLGYDGGHLPDVFRKKNGIAPHVDTTDDKKWHEYSPSSPPANTTKCVLFEGETGVEVVYTGWSPESIEGILNGKGVAGPIKRWMEWTPDNYSPDTVWVDIAEERVYLYPTSGAVKYEKS
jgi:hypothetical protein